MIRGELPNQDTWKLHDIEIETYCCEYLNISLATLESARKRQMKVLKLLEGEEEKKVILQSSSEESITPPPSPPSVNLKKEKTHQTKKNRSRSTSNESSLTPVPSPLSKNSAIIKRISAQYLGVHMCKN